MAVTLHESSVGAITCGRGVARQRLLGAEHGGSSRVLLDRITLAPGAVCPIAVAATSLAWFQILDGRAGLERDAGTDDLTQAHIVFLPPGFHGQLATQFGVSLLFAEVPGAAQHDPGFRKTPPVFRIVDWTREPVLDSEHDARKRIYVATPGLFGTRVIKGEMIIYPPGTAGADHHHEGAEHFMYVLAGSGTAYADDRPLRVREGDLIYYADRERHYLRSDDSGEMRFVEFFVPGTYRTVWSPGAPVCTWVPTGKSINGSKPVRDIEKHSSATATPTDV